MPALSDGRLSALPVNARPRGHGGFTLVELLIAMVVMGIITSIAMVSYRTFAVESRRATALTALSDAASRQEQFFLNNKTYTTTVGAGGLNVSTTVDGGYYTLSVVAPTAACPVTRCWIMQAAPQATQTEDRCGTLSYNSDGDRLPAGCW